jgi:hypothetical protein
MCVHRTAAASECVCDVAGSGRIQNKKALLNDKDFGRSYRRLGRISLSRPRDLTHPSNPPLKHMPPGATINVSQYLPGHSLEGCLFEQEQWLVS